VSDGPDIRLEQVTKRFGEMTAVDALDLEMPRGAFYALLGPSGCGKTTTLRMIGGFEDPTTAASSSAARTSPSTRRTSATSTRSSSPTRCSRT
jgi:ABC-type Fe3+/spermidine/putrescine transport system ATPase subunit